MKWVAMRWKTFVWVSRFLSPAMALLCAFAASTCIHVMYTNPPVPGDPSHHQHTRMRPESQHDTSHVDDAGTGTEIFA